MNKSENHPLLSIILPTYNRATYLPRAINSILQQDYTNWELIIWDDGSTDQTEAVVKGFGDSRIQYYFERNRGAAYARNQAIARSNGDFIAFIDSDDEWLDNKLSIQMFFLLEHPEIDIVFGDFENIDVESNSSQSWFDYSRAGLEYQMYEVYSANFFLLGNGFPESLLRAVFIGLPTIIMRNSHKYRNQFRFNEELTTAEDLELWWRLGLQGYKFAYSKHILMRRYKLRNGLANPSVHYWKNYIKALEFCLNHAQLARYNAAYPLLRNKLQHVWLKLSLSLKIEGHGWITIITAYGKSLTYGRPNKASLAGLAKLIFGYHLPSNTSG